RDRPRGRRRLPLSRAETRGCTMNRPTSARDPNDALRGVYPNLRPRDAATLILIDRSEATPRVLVGRRHHGHVFTPNKIVFPGGRVDPDDHRVPVAAPIPSDL